MIKDWLILIVFGLPLALCLWMTVIAGLIAFWRVYLDERGDRHE